MCEVGYLISDIAEGDRVCIVGGEYQGKAGTVLHVSIHSFLIRLERSGKVVHVKGASNIWLVPDEDNKKV